VTVKHKLHRGPIRGPINEELPAHIGVAAAWAPPPVATHASAGLEVGRPNLAAFTALDMTKMSINPANSALGIGACSANGHGKSFRFEVD
jgi:hypothetical protein